MNTNSQPPMRIYAGDRALAQIRERGLRPGDVGILPGAAGGPKALGLQGLDRVLFGDWLRRAPRRRSLLGSSIGSWRFACVCLPDPVAALQRLGELYTAQRFSRDMTPADVSRQCREMLSDLVRGQEEEILNQDEYRLNVVVVRSRGILGSDTRPLLALGLAGVVLANTLHRPWIRLGFERVILHDPREAPPLYKQGALKGRYAPLSAENLANALLASGSIPMVMEAVDRISGVPGRRFRDGGMVDYHLDLPYAGDDLVLYPHFAERIVPGWFDKALSWRHGDPGRLRNLVLLAPSPDYLESLPDGHLPDRRDFVTYEGDDATRETHWRRAIAESDRLGEYFLELVDNDRVGEVVRPLRDLSG